MRLEHRNLAAVREGLQTTVRVDLLNQAAFWDSRLVSLSADTTRPEVHSSALLLMNNQYFLKAKEILNTSSIIEDIARQVTDHQRQLAELRKQRKGERSQAQWKKLQAQVMATMKECRKGRKQIWVQELAFGFRTGDLVKHSDFYNQHLDRVGIDSDSPLRPEALAGNNKAETTPDATNLAPEQVPEDSRPLKAKGGKRSGANGIDPVKEPQRWLDNLPPFVMIDGKRVNRKNPVKWVLRITSAPPNQRVAAALYYGYEVYQKAPIHRYLGIDRAAVQERLERFQKHAKKQDPNWAEHFSGEQDVFRSRMATRQRK